MARPTKLNGKVQAQIVKLIKIGVSVSDACANAGIHPDTFYDWQRRGEEGDSEFSEFSDKVKRARNAAKVAAIDTLRNSMSPTRTVKRIKNTVTETRFNPYGKEYLYTSTDEHEVTVDMPGDWHAAVEYLKRRYPDEWSEKRILELGLTPELLKRLEDVAKAAGQPVSQIFENMVNALHTRLQLSSGGSAFPDPDRH